MSLLLRSPGPWARDELWRRARAVPALDLLFADNKSLIDVISGQNLITNSRASSGTFVNSQRVIEAAAAGVPSFDHNPLTGESLGLLVDEQRTNLHLHSEDISQWLAPYQLSATLNATIAPDGLLTADRLLETTANDLHAIEGTPYLFVTNTAYTYSVFVKPIGDRNFEIAFPAIVFTGRFARFTLTGSGSVQGTDAGVTASIQAFPNGWYRCIATSTCASGAGARIGNFVNNATNSRSYAGDVAKGIFIWGAQLEVGSSPPTSYIPTTTAAVTRSADMVTIEGDNFSRWYRQGEGTWFVAYDQPAIGGSIAVIDDGTTANAIVLFTNSVAAQRVSSNMLIASSNQGRLDAGGTFVANDISKAALAVSAGGRGLSCNGSVVVTSANPSTMPTLNRLAIQGDSNFSIQKGGHIRRLTYWPRRLDNSILQSLTR